MSTRSTFGTVKRIGAILIAIAIVLAAGIIVGQAPAIFGIDQDPEASIVFDDQQGDGTNVTIDELTLSDGGFVVITDGSTDPIVVSSTSRVAHTRTSPSNSRRTTNRNCSAS